MRRRDQQRGQRDPAALAAGQRADRARRAADAAASSRRAARRARRGRAASAAHTWSGTVADDGVPDVARGVEVVGLGEHADGDAAAVRHPAGVGRLPARRAPAAGCSCRRRCGPRRRPGRRRRGRGRRRPAGCGRAKATLTPSALSRLRHCSPRPACAPSTTRAPGTGPCARRTSAAGPAGGQRGGQVERVLGVAGEEHDGRPGPGDDGAERAVLGARPRACARRSGSSDTAAGCRSLASERAERRRRRRARSALHQGGRARAARAATRPARSRSSSR